MNCSKIRKKLIQFEDTGLPADIRRHVDQCADCARYVRQTQQLKQLLASQNDVAPSPGFETRLLSELRRRIRSIEETPESAGNRFWDFIFGTPVPAYRFALAAVLVLLVGVHVYNRATSLPAQPDTAASPAAITVAAAPAVPAPVTNQAGTEFAAGQNIIGPLRIATNRGPGRVEYGPMPSTLVNFEY